MPVVGPQVATVVPLVWDSDDSGLGGPVDMNGPTIGRVAYDQTANSSLRVRIDVEFAHPNTNYTVFLVGGPSHATATGFISIGVLGTNAVGSGVGAFVVPVATLLAPPFGPGFRTDHLDLLRGVGDITRGVLAAGAINYYVCRTRGTQPPGAAEDESVEEAEFAESQVTLGEPQLAEDGSPDPLPRPKGPDDKEADPLVVG